MNTFLTVKNNGRAAPFWLPARIISIMILAFLWPLSAQAKVAGEEPADWEAYGQTATMSGDGDGVDVVVNVETKTYTVKTARGLAWIAWVTNEEKRTANSDETHSAYYPAEAGFKGCTVVLNGDISLAKPESGVAEDFKESWIPIGYPNKKNFKGTFKGNSHMISDMEIKESVDSGYNGFFGILNGATIMDLTVRGMIELKSSGTASIPLIGGIAGSTIQGTKIINCHNACTINYTGTKNFRVGGITGQIQNTSFIYASSNSAQISITNGGIFSIGGIVGYLMTGSIVSCFNTGDITGSGTSIMIGGLAGYNQGKVLNSYSTGNISGTSTTDNCHSGGITGHANNPSSIISCYATGSVSATNSNEANKQSRAGGIAGYANSTTITIQNCLALNKGGIKALGATSDKSAGRIVGEKKGTPSFDGNYASTKIKLTLGEAEPALPAEDLTASGINGESIYLDEVAAAIAAWAGDENTKAFTAIGTEADGKLPLLKTVDFNGSNEPMDTYGEPISNQPAASLNSAEYLAAIEALVLPQNTNETYTISYPDSKWTYKEGDSGALTRFNGTVNTANRPSLSKLIIENVTGNPTLIFDNVTMLGSDGTPLTINENCELTIEATGAQLLLSSSDGYALVNNGILTLAISDQKTEIILKSSNKAIQNTGTLNNVWMEWQSPTSFYAVDYIATDATDQKPKAREISSKAYATIVEAGKTYRLWKMENSDGDGLARLQGKDSKDRPVVYFQAPAENGLAVFTDMKVAVNATVTQPSEGGSISVFCNDSLVAANDVIPNGATLTCKYNAIPGYGLKSYGATSSDGVLNILTDISSGSYTVPDDAETVIFTATFVKTEAKITEEEVEETVPFDPVDAPTVVIPLGERPSVTGTIKLLTGDLEDKDKTEVDEVITKEGLENDKLIYAEIALVEVKDNGTKVPIQPSANHPVTVIYPYPDGTDASYTFTVVHLKSDGTTEVYSNGNGLLENATAGLKFSVSSFSPFGISWKVKSTPDPGPGPDPTPTPVYYTVTLPAVEGTATDPVAGSYEVENWSSFRFYLTPDKDYDQSVPVVTTSRGETIEPRNSDGAYIIKYVRTPVVVSITGIEKNTDVANSATLEAGLKLWTERSALCLETDRTEEIRIIAITGATVAVFDIQPGLTRRELSPGVYIVKTARSVCKVLVR
ncbi:MAG: GLUG motif-containing protein [Parabacteroides gordonii]|uniref:GLUG motif-containing protein n=1 Tax=Parabacteroides gordonii TaxID=574930 RepID=UPI003A8B6810